MKIENSWDKINSFLKHNSTALTIIMSISGAISLVVGDSFQKLFSQGFEEYWGVDIPLSISAPVSYYLLIFLFVIIICCGVLTIALYHNSKIAENDSKISVFIKEFKIAGIVGALCLLLFYQIVFIMISVDHIDSFKHILFPYLVYIFLVITEVKLDRSKDWKNLVLSSFLPIAYNLFLYFNIFPFGLNIFVKHTILNLVCVSVLPGYFLIFDWGFSLKKRGEIAEVQNSTEGQETIRSQGITKQVIGYFILPIILITFILFYSHHSVRGFGYQRAASLNMITTVRYDEDFYLVIPRENDLVGFKINQGENLFIKKGEYVLLDRFNKEFKIVSVKLSDEGEGSIGVEIVESESK